MRQGRHPGARVGRPRIARAIAPRSQPEQRPGRRVDHEAGVPEAVDQDGDETGRGHDPHQRAARVRAKQGRERADEQTHVHDEADQSLLGGDADRLRVGDRGPRLLDVLEEGTAEGPGAIAGDGAAEVALVAGVGVVDRPGERQPSLDQVGVPGVDAADVLDVAGRGAAGDHEDGQAGQAERPVGDRTAPAVAQDCDDPEPGEQRCGAGDRVAEREGHQADGAHQAGQRQVAAAAAPGDAGRKRCDRQREVAAVDVWVEEDRVDAEVDVQLVRVEELRVEEQVAGEVLVDPDQRAPDGDDPDRDQRPAGELPAPARLADQDEEDRERNEEEADVLDRVGDVDRVGRLDGVEDDGGGEQPAQAFGPGTGVVRRSSFARSVPPGEDRGDHSRADHQVERDEEVRGLAADLHRDAQRQDGKRRDREPLRAAAKGGGQQCERDRADDHRAAELRGAVAEVHHPGLIPDVAEHEHGRGDQRHDHRRLADAPILGNQRHRGGATGDQDPDQFDRRRVHPGAGSGIGLPAVNTVIRRGQIISRRSPGRSTRSR